MFSDGRVAHAPRHTCTQRLDGKTRSQIFLRAGAHPPRPSPVAFGRNHLRLSVSPIPTIIHSKGVHKNHEASSGVPQTNRDSAVNIMGQHVNPTLGEGNSL